MVALQILCEEDDVIHASLRAVFAPVGMFPFSDVAFHADDRLDPRALHLVVERDRPVHIAVIGHRNGARPEILRPLHQWFYLNRAIEKAEVGVKMKVYKIFFVHCSLRIWFMARAKRIEFLVSGLWFA